MKKVAIIGGGTGSAVILQGFKEIENIDISAIVTVADDGGSTGRLRQQFQIPAMGDIRNVMVSLAENESLLGPLMDYRFEGVQDIGGHNLGNLMLTALTQTTGNFMEAIEKLSKVLKVKGKVLPSTTQIVTLMAMMEDGTIVRGESNIPEFNNRILHVFYQERVTASIQAVKAIEEADYIVYGIGSLYTSILPNIIIPEIKNAIVNSQAEKIYFCNAMSQPGETDHYSLEDHVQAINEHASANIVDTVVVFNDILHKKTLDRYLEKQSKPIKITEKEHEYEIIERELLTFNAGFIHHDSTKLKNVFIEILEKE